MMRLCTQELTLKAGEKKLVTNLNLDLKPGEVWGILGQNGSGKSSLLNALAGLITPAFGSIWLNEVNLPGLSRKVIAQHIGLLFQESHFSFPQTVFEYCLAARYPHSSYLDKNNWQDKRIVLRALKKMALDTYQYHRIDTLSGGEKKRLAIASLLAQTPSIYLLDEPTNHLDLKHQIHCLHLMRELAITQSACIVMALHDVNLAQRFCDHLLLLFPDGTTKQGTRDDMLTTAHLSALYQCEIMTHPPKTPFWQAVLL